VRPEDRAAERDPEGSNESVASRRSRRAVTTFPKSRQALGTDRARASNALLAVGAILVISWLVWSIRPHWIVDEHQRASAELNGVAGGRVAPAKLLLRAAGVDRVRR
jgi:hypothetical protein